jgi:hypothetical protein
MVDLTRPPIVFWRRQASNVQIEWGYLVIVDGAPWLAASESDITERPVPTWRMRPFDPTLLEEQTSPAHDRQSFLYRGDLSGSS